MVFSAQSTSSCNYWEASAVAKNSDCAELWTQPLPLSKSGIPADSVWHGLSSVSPRASRERLCSHRAALTSNEFVLEFRAHWNYHVPCTWRAVLTYELGHPSEECVVGKRSAGFPPAAIATESRPARGRRRKWGVLRVRQGRGNHKDNVVKPGKDGDRGGQSQKSGIWEVGSWRSRET